jgi:hypothetical protein
MFECVDCVASFFLLHDLLQACDGDFNQVLVYIQANFPNMKHIILADTARTSEFGYATTMPPVFVRGFELVHAMMGIPTRTIDDYRKLMVSSCFRLDAVIPLNVPNSYIFSLKRVTESHAHIGTGANLANAERREY